MKNSEVNLERQIKDSDGILPMLFLSFRRKMFILLLILYPLFQPGVFGCAENLSVNAVITQIRNHDPDRGVRLFSDSIAHERQD